jgi:microcystin-dependent protein
MEGTIGEIRMFAGTFAPRFWAYCNNQLISISSNTALFAILGTTYGGNGQTTFALPDMRSRMALGTGQGPGLPSVQLGQLSGTPTATLLANNMPAHSHSLLLTVTPQGAGSGTLGTDPTGRVPGPGNFYSSDTAEVVNMAPATSNLTVGSAGGSQPFSIMPPYLGMNFIICMFGIFPSRN